jgi:hypothetical protein
VRTRWKSENIEVAGSERQCYVSETKLPQPAVRLFEVCDMCQNKAVGLNGDEIE